jgi:hypothetical protein
MGIVYYKVRRVLARRPVGRVTAVKHGKTRKDETNVASLFMWSRAGLWNRYRVLTYSYKRQNFLLFLSEESYNL